MLSVAKQAVAGDKRTRLTGNAWRRDRGVVCRASVVAGPSDFRQEFRLQKIMRTLESSPPFLGPHIRDRREGLCDCGALRRQVTL
jgi:hypothetical protein